MTIADDALLWADKIDRRLGPISGRDADALAQFLRRAARRLATVAHPTSSEQFADWLDRLGIPAPWTLCEDSVGKLLAANKSVACTARDSGFAALDERATEAAVCIMCAINTLAGFKAERRP